MDKESAIELVRQYLALLKENHLNVESAWMFGSYAQGNFHKDSDIDLALVFPSVSDRIDLQTSLLILGRKFEYIIEPHPFSTKEFNLLHPLVNEILSKGIKVA